MTPRIIALAFFSLFCAYATAQTTVTPPWIQANVIGRELELIDSTQVEYYFYATSLARAQPFWTKANVTGLEMELVDPERVLQYFFGDDGVAISVGTKNGSVAAPSAEWRIVDGRLVVGFFGHPGIAEPESTQGFTILSRDTSTIVLRDGATGEVKTFKVLRNP